MDIWLLLGAAMMAFVAYRFGRNIGYLMGKEKARQDEEIDVKRSQINK
jgi:hypothetical protein